MYPESKYFPKHANQASVLSHWTLRGMILIGWEVERIIYCILFITFYSANNWTQDLASFLPLRYILSPVNILKFIIYFPSLCTKQRRRKQSYNGSENYPTISLLFIKISFPKSDEFISKILLLNTFSKECVLPTEPTNLGS